MVDDIKPHDEGAEMYVNPKTGGHKQTKKARFDLIPPDVEWELAELFGEGAVQYQDRNWERGYPWSLSYAAARRHLSQFWAGQDQDEVTGVKHVLCAAWHCIAMARFMNDPETYEEFDNRPYGTFIPAEIEVDSEFKLTMIPPQGVIPPRNPGAYRWDDQTKQYYTGLRGSSSPLREETVHVNEQQSLLSSEDEICVYCDEGRFKMNCGVCHGRGYVNVG